MVSFEFSEIYFPHEEALWKELDWLWIIDEENIAADLFITFSDRKSRVNTKVVLPEIALLGASFNICDTLKKLLQGEKDPYCELAMARYYFELRLLESGDLTIQTNTLVTKPENNIRYYGGIPKDRVFENITFEVNWNDFVLAAIAFQREAFHKVFSELPELYDHEDQYTLNCFLDLIYENEEILVKSLKR